MDGKENIEEPRLVAVLIGIDDYACEKLLYPGNDVDHVSGALYRRWSGKIRVMHRLTNNPLPEKPNSSEYIFDTNELTRDSILNAIRKASESAKDRDTFLIYLSGHGVIVNDEPCLVIKNDADGRPIETLSVCEIVEQADQAIKSKLIHPVMFLDFCQKFNQPNQSDTGLSCLSKSEDRWSFFFACSPGQVSREAPSEDRFIKNSWFASSLANAIDREGRLPDGSLDLLNLVNVVCEKVQMESLRGTIRGKNTSFSLPERQNPLLLSRMLSAGGKHRVLIAPKFNISKNEPEDWATFAKTFIRFLSGKWPYKIRLRFLFLYCGAVVYAALIALSIMQYAPMASEKTTWAFALISVAIWYLSATLAVTGNECYRHDAGYVTGLMFIFWHSFISVWLILFNQHSTAVNSLQGHSWAGVADVMGLSLIIVVFVCNTNQMIITLSEFARPGPRNRSDHLRLIIFEFEEQKRPMNVVMNNLISVQSAHPRVYFLAYAITLLLVFCFFLGLFLMGILQIFPKMLLVVKAVVFLFFLSGLLFWYYSAYNHIVSTFKGAR